MSNLAQPNESRNDTHHKNKSTVPAALKVEILLL
jgi:hypothetical protein